MSFEQWAKELERIADGAYGKGYDFTQECWREVFDEGKTPQEAFEEDRDCWDWAEE